MFNTIKNIFSNKEPQAKSKLILAAPLEGELVSITEVPDPVFSEKMMGDGFAIKPTLGIIVSPIEGTVGSIFPTKHAIGLTSKEGYEIIIHFGLETVSLNGEGFEVLAEVGQKVSIGDELLKIDIEKIKDKVPSIITPVVIANLKEDEKIVVEKYKQVSLAERAVAVIIKK
ncbi:PTS glucose transporter subunit IIA [Clostridium sp. YIM B02506]|uniref:PTS sugar transporter subunit IIA n=1 Tax=Clostridium sp. YIM B02506 TaxID=2910680 RepID=UPI001EEDE487|nr:PTS glucose transporter subunit IIA [Clostridium sp. YIM B02506]